MTEEHEQQPLTGESPNEDPSSSEADPHAEGPGDEPSEQTTPSELEGDDGEEVAFEDAVQELETIVEELESGDLPLEEAMDRFERGLILVDACRSKLEQAELKVQELLSDGETTTLENGAE